MQWVCNLIIANKFFHFLQLYVHTYHLSEENILCILHPSAIPLCIRLVIFNIGVSLPAW